LETRCRQMKPAREPRWKAQPNSSSMRPCAWAARCTSRAAWRRTGCWRRWRRRWVWRGQCGRVRRSGCI